MEEPNSMRNFSKEKVKITYGVTNRAKCSSKKKGIFKTKDMSTLGKGEEERTLREGEERRSASSIGFYLTDRTQHSQSGYNRYLKNQYSSSIGNSKTSLKAKGNTSVLQRHFKNRGPKML